MNPALMRHPINVMHARERLEEHGLLEGVRAYAEAHDLDWDVIPLSGDKPVSCLSLRAGTRGVLIGRPRPDASNTPAADYPWVEWVPEGSTHKETPAFRSIRRPSAASPPTICSTAGPYARDQTPGDERQGPAAKSQAQGFCREG